MKIRENIWSRAQVYAYEEDFSADALIPLLAIPFSYIKLYGEEGSLELRHEKHALSGVYTFDCDCGEKARGIHVYLPYDETVIMSWIDRHIGKFDVELVKYSLHPAELEEYCNALQKHIANIYINLPIGYVVDKVFKIFIHPWAEYSKELEKDKDILIIKITTSSFSYELLYEHAPELFEKE